MSDQAPPLEAFQLDAYGHLTYPVGWSDEYTPEGAADRGDWLACADLDRRGAWVAYHVVVDSDSEGFTDTLASGVLSLEDARAELPGLLDSWHDIGSEQLAGDGLWFTDDETKENQRILARWREAVAELLK